MKDSLEFVIESDEGRIGLNVLHNIGYVPFPKSEDPEEKVHLLKDHPDAKPGDITIQFYTIVTHIGRENRHYKNLQGLFETQTVN